ncbi:MAG: ComEC/Rec2 family competence protein [Pirellulales bacterium]
MKSPDSPHAADDAEAASTSSIPRSMWTTLLQRAHRVPLVIAVAAMLVGTAAMQWIGASGYPLFVVAALLCSAAAVISSRSGRPTLASVAGLAALMSAAAAMHHLQSTPRHDDLAAVAGKDFQPLVFRAQILEPAVWRPNAYHRPSDPSSEVWRTQWRVRCLEVRNGTKWQTAHAYSTLSTAGRVDHLLPGDEVTVFGSCAAVTGPTNPGENDMRLVMAREHQFVFLRTESAAQIRLDRVTWQRPLQRLIGIAVRKLDVVVHRETYFGQGSLAAALIFGQKEQVDWQEQQNLLSTGTLHMLAISGMHIELVAGALLSICIVFGLSKRTTLIVISSTVIVYGLISGADPPVLRAVFIVSAVCLAKYRGKRTGMANLLAFAGVMILAMKTSWISNVGVQLSFLAVAVIGLYSGRFDSQAAKRSALQATIEESWSRRRRWTMRILRTSWDLLSISFWVWLITAPLIWNQFHVVSIIAVPLNVLLWIFLVTALLSGLALCVLFWLPPVASVLGFICGLSLAIISALVAMADRLPGAHVWMPAPPMWWTVVFYAAAAVGSVAVMIRPRLKPVLGVALTGWLLIGMSPWLVGPHSHAPRFVRDVSGAWLQGRIDKTNTEEFRMTFIDVGHGTSVLMRMPGGEVVLYDAGHLSGADRSHQEIAGVLWSEGTARIDELFLSHADTDHYNAVPGLLSRFSVERVSAPSQFWDHSDAEVKQVVATIRSAGTECLAMQAGEERRYGEIVMTTIHPPSDWHDGSDNGDSLCLVVRAFGRTILLPGDLEKGGLRRLLDLPPMACDVIMAPHHGSLTHDPRMLSAWAHPDWTIISGGQRAARETVETKYRPTGGQVGITHRDGAVQVRIAQDGDMQGDMSVWHWVETEWQPLVDRPKMSASESAN